MSKIEYRIIESAESDTLAKEVNKALNEDWMLLGTPKVALKSDAAKIIFIQAMTRVVKAQGKVKRKMSDWAK